MTVSSVPGSKGKLLWYTYIYLLRAKQLYLANMFEDEAGEKLIEVPEEENKPDNYARKTCNYLTAVL